MDHVLLDLIGLADAVSKNGFYMADQLVQEPCRQMLLAEAKKLHHHEAFRPAQIGKGSRKQVVQRVRGDQICWIEDWRPPPLAMVKSIFDHIQLLSRRRLFLPIRRFESHFAHYPVGTFYKKHVDQHRFNPSRILSCVLYLGDWQAGDGGELVLYHGPCRESTVVAPMPGRLVLFESKMLHEVLPTRVPRWSFTTWFRDDLHPNVNLNLN